MLFLSSLHVPIHIPYFSGLVFRGVVCWRMIIRDTYCRFTSFTWLKVARYSFSRSIPPKFDRKLRRYKQRFGKIDTTVVLDKGENLL